MANQASSIEVLMVEDSPTDAQLAVEALEHAKVKVSLHIVDDGFKAMDFLKRRNSYADAPRPDLVLLDLNLPKKDGHEVLREIRSDPNIAIIPVVILTTSDDDRDVQAPTGAGKLLRDEARRLRSLHRGRALDRELLVHGGPTAAVVSPRTTRRCVDRQRIDAFPIHCPSGVRMGSMLIAFELTPDDIRYFRSCLQTVKKGALSSDESVVLKAAADLMAQVAAAEAPEFVQERISKLSLLVHMLKDQRWRLTGPDRARVLNVLAYFVDPDDLIPDRIPGLGYLDDAIMVELVLQELRHEIEAYKKFCEFSAIDKRAPEEIARKRVQLQNRMRRNQRIDRERRKRMRTGGRKAPMGLW